MKSVVLIGDSIRMGYEEAVKLHLADAASIWTPKQNGGNSANVLKNLDDWAISQKPDVVHINCGLHDLRKEFDAEESAIPLPQYTDNVRSILTRLKNETSAKVLFALTTPVNEKWHHERKGFDRFEADVDAYNKAASSVAQELDVEIDDLFKVVMDAGRDDIMSQDGVHYTDEGYRVLGKAVAAFLRPFL